MADTSGREAFKTFFRIALGLPISLLQIYHNSNHGALEPPRDRFCYFSQGLSALSGSMRHDCLDS